jgi:hypothetical protein
MVIRNPLRAGQRHDLRRAALDRRTRCRIALGLRGASLESGIAFCTRLARRPWSGHDGDRIFYDPARIVCFKVTIMASQGRRRVDTAHVLYRSFGRFSKGASS